MLGMIGIALLVVVLAVAVILAVAATRPDEFHAARSAQIAAAPDRLFPLINDLRQMNRWNPYALRETGGTSSYSGPEAGKGARFLFDGPKSGTGSIEIVDSVPPSRVVMRLAMSKPFRADNRVELTLQPAGSSTDVTWAMSGRQPLLAKAMTLFIDCDRMIGRDFEEGLQNLRRLAEV